MLMIGVWGFWYIGTLYTSGFNCLSSGWVNSFADQHWSVDQRLKNIAVPS